MTPAPPWRFAVLLPRVADPRIKGGGHLNTLRFAELLSAHAPCHPVSYEAREEGVWYLPDVEAQLIAEGYVMILTWGPHVAGHLGRFHGRLPLLYYQQSMDWGFNLPPDVPVLSMSKYMMGYAQRTWPHCPQLYLPPVLERDCRNLGLERDIDVLIIPRKQPAYVFDTLLPRLRDRCTVHVLDRFVPRADLHQLFNRTKVYVYAFAPQRSPHTSSRWRYMEGISTQNLEALACGCTVISDLRGGHVDFLEPGVHGYRLMSHSPAWDVEQIVNAVANHPQPAQATLEAYLEATFGEEVFHRRAAVLLRFLDDFLPFTATHPADPTPFGVPAPVQWHQAWGEYLRGRLYRLKRRLLGRGRSAGR